MTDLSNFTNLSHDGIKHWLLETDETLLEELWSAADRTRKENVGDEVHLRGLIEISNHCSRQCMYCGIRASNTGIERYRLPAETIIKCAHVARELGYGTVVMQGGEDWAITKDWLASVIREIKAATGLAVTLSLGERRDDELEAWREAGADRYLLRFETSDPELFARIHPGRNNEMSQPEDRFEILRRVRELGYEAGSGVLIGIPGQSYDSLARDIATFRELDLDMIGVGPYICHPDTPMGQGLLPKAAEGLQVPSSELMTYKVVALTRLSCPESNIPSTTALASLNYESGRELGLSRGANIIMPNLTPPEFRYKYEIYPAKACIQESAEDFHTALNKKIKSIGRFPGKGHGGRNKRS